MRFNVSLLGSPARALPLSEIDFTALPAGLPHIITYAGKWDVTSVECTATPSVMSGLEGHLRDRVIDVAVRAFAALECQDYGRIDIRLALDGSPYVIDVNPNCDLAPTSGFARAAASGGLEYPELIDQLVQLARARSTPRESVPRVAELRPDARPDLRVVGTR